MAKKQRETHHLSEDRKDKAVKALKDMSERDRNKLDAIAWIMLWGCDAEHHTHEVNLGLTALLYDHHELIEALRYDHEDKVHERSHGTGQRPPGWYTERDTGPFKSKALAILASFRERHLP